MEFLYEYNSFQYFILFRYQRLNMGRLTFSNGYPSPVIHGMFEAENSNGHRINERNNGEANPKNVMFFDGMSAVHVACGFDTVNILTLHVYTIHERCIHADLYVCIITCICRFLCVYICI